MAPVVRLQDPAREHGPVGLEQLAGDFQVELVQAGESGQVGAREGSVEHVEVFRVAGVGTAIFERPRPLSRHRRADPGRVVRYTLNCEEP